MIRELLRSLRTLRRSPGVSLAAIAAFALAIGANAAVFSVVDRVLVRSTPAIDPERVVVIWAREKAGSTVYVTGFSGGARMSSLIACRLNTRVAAIAPMAGLRWPGPCEGRPVPILTFHGLADPQNPYAGHAEGRGAEWLESVPEALAAWARHNGCKPDVIMEDPPGPLSTMRYAGCHNDAEVRLIRIDGMGHTWAREEVDATAARWQFFRAHTLQR